uniref:Peptidase S1 domain-containing protein n=1 Tax=Xiphophorus couchianus TaxID=32473 RepID=A0A3B5L9Q8_9TELE
MCYKQLLSSPGVAVSSASLQKRVIGGQNCRDDERHYHVTVYRHSSTGTTICGGSLISDQWVLTAAHCWDLTEKSPITDYSNGREHDIMLLRLSGKTTIQPIRLPDCPDTLLLQQGHILSKMCQHFNRPYMFTCCFSSTGANDRNDLQCAEFKIAKHEKMETTLAKDEDFRFRYQKWYSVRSSKKDMFRDDSGGGCVFNSRLYGVYVYTGETEKALNAPSLFLDVCAYKQWIEDTIK